MFHPADKRHSRVRRRLILSGATAAALLPGAAPGAAAAAGHAEDIKGGVTAELASHSRVLLPRGDVFVGDAVATAENARAALRLGRDTSLRLGANARVRIDRFIVNAGGVITLEAGPLLLDKMPGGPERPIQVRGAFGLITVRGTKIFVGPSQGVIGIFVVHGLITVTARGESFALQTGEGTNIAFPAAGGLNNRALSAARPTPPAEWGEARVREALASVD